jgi:hypothetical protein
MLAVLQEVTSCAECLPNFNTLYRFVAQDESMLATQDGLNNLNQEAHAYNLLRDENHM